MPTLEANLILRWLLDDVPTQTEAVDLLFAQSTELVAPDVVLIEVVFVLERVMRISRPAISEGLHALMGRANIKMDRSLWTEVLNHYDQLPKLSIADIFLALQAEDRGEAPLLTFDKKLEGQMTSAELL